MKASLRFLPLAALLAVPATLRAQNELSNFSATGRGGVINTFATDYQSIGINPANLGRAHKAKVAFTIGEVGFGAASESLSRTLFDKLIYTSNDALPASKTSPERIALVSALTSENVFNLNTDVTTFGIAVTLPNGMGGLAFSNRHRVGSHLALNRTAADIIVNGKNADIYTNYNSNTAPKVSAALDGTNMQASWTSEYNLSYGVNVLDKEDFKLSGGLGYRYIQGIGIADVRIESGTVYAYNALSPVFNINYGTIPNGNFNATTGSGLKSVGNGHGFDLGLAAEVGKGLRLGVSVVDMGSMTWEGNVLTANDQQLKPTNSSGVSSYNIFEELANQFDNDNESLFKYDPAKEQKGALPTKLRTGAGYRISELFEAGLDVTVPLNDVAGNLTSPFLGVGVDYKPAHWVRLSTGVSGGAGYGASLPLGITFVTKAWEAGVSSRDVTGYFSEESPYTSLAFGFLRFKIGSDE